MKLQLVSIATFFALIQAQPVVQVTADALNPQSSLIDCTWPCPNPADGCIVTNEGASCAARGEGRWEIKTPLEAPIYTGRPVVRPMDTCQPAPIPNLPAGDVASNSGQSVIMWPMQPEGRPLDEYLGNCHGGMFCSSAGDDKANPVCRIRYIVGASCVSHNQCYSGKCVNNVCETGNATDNGINRR